MSIYEDVDLTPPTVEGVLTPGAVAFAADMERLFRSRRAELLEARRERLAAIANGAQPRLPAATSKIRRNEWQVAIRPERTEQLSVDVLSLSDPAVGLSLVSGVRLCITDCALSHDWADLLNGHAAVRKAKSRQSNRTALTAMRPRPLDVDEPNMMIDGQPMSASIFDFSVSIYHAAKLGEAMTKQRFELAGIENHLEARLWNDIISHAQSRLGLPTELLCTIVAVDNHPALFELDEILFELRHFGAAPRSIGGVSQANLVAAIAERRGSLRIEPSIDLTACENPAQIAELPAPTPADLGQTT